VPCHQRPSCTVTEEARGKSASGGIYLLAVVVGMVGATYASVGPDRYWPPRHRMPFN